jgi:hypothetical protein
MFVKWWVWGGGWWLWGFGVLSVLGDVGRFGADFDRFWYFFMFRIGGRFFVFLLSAAFSIDVLTVCGPFGCILKLFVVAAEPRFGNLRVNLTPFWVVFGRFLLAF